MQVNNKEMNLMVQIFNTYDVSLFQKAEFKSMHDLASIIDKQPSPSAKTRTFIKLLMDEGFLFEDIHGKIKLNKDKMQEFIENHEIGKFWEEFHDNTHIL